MTSGEVEFNEFASLFFKIPILSLDNDSSENKLQVMMIACYASQPPLFCCILCPEFTLKLTIAVDADEERRSDPGGDTGARRRR
jgi:hypothetical protein